jgi:hypothetical protein
MLGETDREAAARVERCGKRSSAREVEKSADLSEGYSRLKASTRFTPVARRAGTMHASNPARVKVTTIAAYTVGSFGFTWKRATWSGD